MEHDSKKRRVSAVEAEEYHVLQAQAFVDHYKLDQLSLLGSNDDLYLKWCDSVEKVVGVFGRDCLAARAVELITLRMLEPPDELKWDMLNLMGEHVKVLAIKGVLESDARGMRAAVDKCIEDGATPLACMELVLNTMTVNEASYIGW
jgi:hypothetical protein